MADVATRLYAKKMAGEGPAYIVGIAQTRVDLLVLHHEDIRATNAFLARQHQAG